MVQLCPVFYQYMHCTALMPTLISVQALILFATNTWLIWINLSYHLVNMEIKSLSYYTKILKIGTRSLPIYLPYFDKQSVSMLELVFKELTFSVVLVSSRCKELRVNLSLRRAETFDHVYYDCEKYLWPKEQISLVFVCKDDALIKIHLFVC